MKNKLINNHGCFILFLHILFHTYNHIKIHYFKSQHLKVLLLAKSQMVQI